MKKISKSVDDALDRFVKGGRTEQALRSALRAEFRARDAELVKACAQAAYAALYRRLNANEAIDVAEVVSAVSAAGET